MVSAKGVRTFATARSTVVRRQAVSLGCAAMVSTMIVMALKTALTPPTVATTRTAKSLTAQNTTPENYAERSQAAGGITRMASVSINKERYVHISRFL
jgi:hypothetical protein